MKKITRQASLTAEAALVLPIFLFAMVLIGMIGKLTACQDDVQWALTRIAREASAGYGATQSDKFRSKLYYQTRLAACIQGAGLSVSLRESRLLEENDEIDLIAVYHVKLPFSVLPIPDIRMRQRVHTRAFTGVEQRGQKGMQADRLVYITETGHVYHLDLKCTYLKLSISRILYEDLPSKRNDGGGRYLACERCCPKKKLAGGTDVWITNYGDRYHTTASCSGLKRTIRQVKLSEAGGRTPCSKCGKER